MMKQVAVGAFTFPMSFTIFQVHGPPMGAAAHGKRESVCGSGGRQWQEVAITEGSWQTGHHKGRCSLETLHWQCVMLGRFGV